MLSTYMHYLKERNVSTVLFGIRHMSGCCLCYASLNTKQHRKNVCTKYYVIFFSLVARSKAYTFESVFICTCLNKRTSAAKKVRKLLCLVIASSGSNMILPKTYKKQEVHHSRQLLFNLHEHQDGLKGGFKYQE